MDIKIQKIVNLRRCHPYFSFNGIVQMVETNPPRLLQTRLILICIFTNFNTELFDIQIE